MRSLARISFAAFSFALTLSGIASAQWDVQPGDTTLSIEGEVYADHACNNLGGPPPCPRPGLGALHGTCLAGPRLPPANSVLANGATSAMLFPSVFFDFGSGVDFVALDDVGPGCFTSGSWAESNAVGYFQGDGLGSRTLDLFFNAEVNNGALNGEDFFMRGCLSLNASLTAYLTVPATTRPFFLRWDLDAAGDAGMLAECPFPPECAAWGLPDPEDFETSIMTVDIDVAATGVQSLLNQVLGVPAGGPGVYGPQTNYDSMTFPAGGPLTMDVVVGVSALTEATTQFPDAPHDDGEANFVGHLSLHLITHDFVTDEPFDSYMRLVPQGGPGPRYAFRVGRSEITNQQYADFLNSAEDDAGATGLGSYMTFGSDGAVRTPRGALMFLPKGPSAPGSQIVYDAGAPRGMRYTVRVAQGADPRSHERHPVNYVTWLGAVKFCNWLTLTRGLGAGERCYTEGDAAVDWHPVTIATVDWAMRDLTSAERAHLVARCEGFRLPMDALDSQLGWIGSQASLHNEWYKAAAYDPSAPASVRTGPGGEVVPPFHRVYGFGRDAFTADSANTLTSGDPFDDASAFVSMYDGTTYNLPGSERVGSGVTYTTAADSNRWDLRDMSGNIGEWAQDQVPGQGRAVRGGSWNQLFAESAASYREARIVEQAESWLGFRVWQSLPAKVATAPAPQSVPPITVR